MSLQPNEAGLKTEEKKKKTNKQTVQEEAGLHDNVLGLPSDPAVCLNSILALPLRVGWPQACHLASVPQSVLLSMGIISADLLGVLLGLTELTKHLEQCLAHSMCQPSSSSPSY